jgi:UDP-GlcNAc:undecaprenyl-phosphate GlcNAc-1-phosphate transferase
VSTFLYAYFGSAFLAVLLTPGIIRLARRVRAMDQPGVRGVHQRPIPRLGGVAIFLSAVAPLAALVVLDGAADAASRDVRTHLLALFCAATLIFLVGLADDLKDVPARLKLWAELLIAGGLCLAGVRISSLALTDQWVLHLGGWGALLTILWIVGVTNAVNLSDGLDGLAAGICAITAGVLALVALSHGEILIGLVLVALLGSLSGFLLFNFHPARIFMGDGGSLFLGFTLGACSVICVARSEAGVGLAAAALTLGIPILDTLVSALRRFLEGRSVFSPDRGHFHHRLLDLGLPQRQAVLLIYGATLLAAGLGLLLRVRHGLDALALFGGGLLLILLLFRAVGALRLRQTVARLRQKSAYARQMREERQTFERLQLYLRMAKRGHSSFSPESGALPGGRTSTEKVECPLSAWQTVCAAAEQLELAWVSLQWTNPQGEVETSLWRRQSVPAGFARIVTMSFPVGNTAGGQPVECEIAVLVNGSLQSANHRAGLFVRLAQEASCSL